MTTRREQEQPIAVRERERPGRPMLWPDDMERFFTRAMRGFDMGPWRGFGRLRPMISRTEAWLPDMDVLEQEGKLVVRMDLPGMKREDIDVAIEGDMLVVSGHRAEEKEVKEEDYYCTERSSGSFRRAVRLPEGANADAIEANYQDGVLEVRIPRPAAPEPKKLKVDVK
jgi:HSP20 family protein